MSLFIDKKYVSLLSTRLQRYTQKGEYLWNFRCPICGDSQKNKAKARGYIFRGKSDLFFSCHNCGTSISFGNFLKTLDPSMYRDYQLERFKNENSGNVAKPDFSLAKEKPVFNIQKKINLPTIESLPNSHPAKDYILKRKIPREKYFSLYYAEDFREFVYDIIPDYDKPLIPNEKRIVLPFYDIDDKLLGFQGRAISNSKVKYITIKLDDENRKVFGLNTINFDKPIYVVEGPLDSLFLENCLAMMDASLYTVVSSVGDHNYTFVFDNEPRNNEVCKHMKKTIDMGRKICIWPTTNKYKDINDMILSGMSGSEIQHMIDKHTYSDARARLEFEMWKK